MDDKVGATTPMYYQLVEMFCQGQYKTGGPAEAFTTGELELAKHRSNVHQRYKKWKPILDEFARRKTKFKKMKFKIISTWPVGGEKPGLLYSQPVANDYAFDGMNWVNAIDDPVYPETDIPEEMYSADLFSKEQIQVGRKRIINAIDETIASGKADELQLLFVCKNQTKLFPDDGLVKLLRKKKGFNQLDLQDGLVCFTRDDVFITVYRPLGFAMDSRPGTAGDICLKMKRYETIEVIHKGVLFLRGKEEEIVFDTSKGPDAITAGFNFFAVSEMLHMNERTAAAFARDCLTRVNVKAVERTNLPKLSDDKSAHTTLHCRCDYNPTKLVEPIARPLEPNFVIRAANYLSHTSASTLQEDFDVGVRAILQDEDGARPEIVNLRYESLLTNHLCGALQKECRQLFESGKTNNGNRIAHHHDNIEGNDVVFKKILKSKEILVMEVTPKNDLERNFKPSDYPKSWKPFNGEDVYVVPQGNFVYEGLKTRFRNQKKQNNTAHVKACEWDGRKRLELLQHVHCRLDDKNIMPTTVPLNKKGKKKGKKKGWRDDLHKNATVFKHFLVVDK